MGNPGAVWSLMVTFRPGSSLQAAMNPVVPTTTEAQVMRMRFAPSMIDLDASCFTTSDACIAAAIGPTTLKSWLGCEPAIILLRENDQAASGAGHEHLLTLRRVYQIALTAELMRLGVAAQRAGNLAALFTDQGGEKPADWRSNPDYMLRRPGHLFESGCTVLVANKDDSRFGPIISAVTNVPLMADFKQHKTSAIVAEVDEVVGRALWALRLIKPGTTALLLCRAHLSDGIGRHRKLTPHCLTVTFSSYGRC
jgi:hypothetical protein